MHKNRIPRRSFEHETAKTQVSQGLSIVEHLEKKKKKVWGDVFQVYKAGSTFKNQSITSTG